MLRSDFTTEAPGILVQTLQGCLAFVPQPLPPVLTPSWELSRLVSEADRALSELAGTARRLPNPHLLINPFVRREAVLSSRIEGTQTSLSELLYFEADERPTQSDGDVREVMNYVTALEYGLQMLNEVPLGLRLLCQMHGLLMAQVRGENLSPGEFRTSQNWIAGRRPSLDEARFVPPPPEALMEAFTHLERYIHEPSELPSLVRLALIHYQFETIHPFIDGNGRIGRLLISLLLCSEQLLPLPLLYLSAYLESHKDEYCRLLLAVSQQGAWQDWISFFLKGVALQARDAIERSDRLLALQQAYRQRLQSARTSALLLELIDRLFLAPAITVTRAAAHLKVTPRSAQQNIDKLVDAGVLREVTGRQRYRLYMAPEIVGVIDAASFGG